MVLTYLREHLIYRVHGLLEIRLCTLELRFGIDLSFVSQPLRVFGTDRLPGAYRRAQHKRSP